MKSEFNNSATQRYPRKNLETHNRITNIRIIIRAVCSGFGIIRCRAAWSLCRGFLERIDYPKCWFSIIYFLVHGKHFLWRHHGHRTTRNNTKHVKILCENTGKIMRRVGIDGLVRRLKTMTSARCFRYINAGDSMNIKIRSAPSAEIAFYQACIGKMLPKPVAFGGHPVIYTPDT